MKVLVCGGRYYADEVQIRLSLEGILREHGISAVIQGGASGADLLAKQWAERAGIHCVEVPALWRTRGKAAGHARNSAMLALLPDLCVAFPGGPGTANMVRQCGAARIPVVVVPVRTGDAQ